MLHFANYLHLYRGSNACNTCCIVGLHFCWTVNDKLGTFLSWRPTPCSHGASHNVLSASVWNCEKPKCLLCAKLCPPLVESKWCSFWWKASPCGQHTTFVLYIVCKKCLVSYKVVEQQPVKWAEWTFVTLVNTPRWQPVQPGYGPPQGDGAKFCFVSNSWLIYLFHSMFWKIVSPPIRKYLRVLQWSSEIFCIL